MGNLQKVNGMKKCIGVCLMCLLSVVAFGQIKGKARHLVGVWRYEGGSGYEIWTLNNTTDELIGSGYRYSKLGDTIRVEDLRIALVKGNYVYTLTTTQQVDSAQLVKKHVFVAERRKLDFANTDNGMPNGIRYMFPLFSKRKLKIIIRFDGEEKETKLRLKKVSNMESRN